jgi:Coenzyme PQQ synthesis protein D (PqqD)
MKMRHRVNSPNVIHETIEGEVILIDLKTGTYYSLRGVGAAIWQGIVAGADGEQIADELRRRYDASEDQTADAVKSLIAELERESLIRADDGLGDAAQVPIFENGAGPPLPFEPPSLEKHSDMQDLILLDPVHEVGAEGWPQPKPEGGA